MSKAIKYPALYADVLPADAANTAVVRCTATLRELGHVWWTLAGGTTVAWHFKVGGTTGERNTERNCVQALRDIANASSRRPLLAMLEDSLADRPAPPKRDARPVVASPARVAEPVRQVVVDAPPVPPRRTIVWDDAAPVSSFDIAGALAAGLRKK